LDKKVELEINDEARAWLAKHGHDPQMGARPMSRLIQDTLKKPLADAILFGELQKGGKAHVVLIDGEIKIEYPSTIDA